MWTPDGAGLKHVQIQQMRPGPLAFDIDVIYRRFPELIERYERLVDDNFAQREYFVSPATIEQESSARLQRVLQSPHRLSLPGPGPSQEGAARDSSTDPFA